MMDLSLLTQKTASHDTEAKSATGVVRAPRGASFPNSNQVLDRLPTAKVWRAVLSGANAVFCPTGKGRGNHV